MAVLFLKDFNVSADNTKLVVDVTVNDVYQNVYIDALKVSCDGTFEDEATTKFDTLISVATNEYTQKVIDWEDPSVLKQIRVTLPLNKAPYVFCPSPFYVWITVVDPEGEITSCAENTQLKACTFNKYPLYRHIACAAKTLDGCEPPLEFIDYMLRLQALEANLAIGSAIDINYYYSWLIAHSDSDCTGESPANHTPLNPKSGCGCQS